MQQIGRIIALTNKTNNINNNQKQTKNMETKTTNKMSEMNAIIAGINKVINFGQCINVIAYCNPEAIVCPERYQGRIGLQNVVHNYEFIRFDNVDGQDYMVLRTTPLSMIGKTYYLDYVEQHDDDYKCMALVSKDDLQSGTEFIRIPVGDIKQIIDFDWERSYIPSQLIEAGK